MDGGLALFNALRPLFAGSVALTGEQHNTRWRAVGLARWWRRDKSVTWRVGERPGDGGATGGRSQQTTWRSAFVY